VHHVSALGGGNTGRRGASPIGMGEKGARDEEFPGVDEGGSARRLELGEDVLLRHLCERWKGVRWVKVEVVVRQTRRMRG
jgi:hypothetical protein